MMKKLTASIAMLLGVASTASAHQIWIEQPDGQNAVVRFGEFGDNLREALMLSDRIIVLSPRPAHVMGIFDVRLPRQYRNPGVMSDLLRSFHQKFPDIN